MQARLPIRLLLSAILSIPFIVILVLIHAGFIYVGVSNASAGWGPPWHASEENKSLEYTLSVLSLNPFVWFQSSFDKSSFPQIFTLATILWIPFISFSMAFLIVSLFDKKVNTAEQDAAANP